MEKYTKTTTTSFKDRVIGAFLGVIVGLILFVASFFVLWQNEGKSVLLIKQHDIAKKEAIPIMASPINRANDNKLVQLNGYALSKAILTDRQIVVKDALSLHRLAEMYQWEETKSTSSRSNAGGSETRTTSYSYKKIWSDKQIYSSSFERPSGHENPLLTERTIRVNADSAALGDFRLDQSQINRMSDFVLITNLPRSNKYSIVDGKYYTGVNIDDPQVGDVRITYSCIPSNSPVSIIAEQKSNNTLGSYDVSNTSVYIQMDGIKNKQEMLDKFKTTNMLMTFGFRLLGFVLMFFGLKLIINPLVTISKIIPPLAWLVEFASGFALAILALILSLSTIMIAWFAFRPTLSLILFAVIVGLFILLMNKNKR